MDVQPVVNGVDGYVESILMDADGLSTVILTHPQLQNVPSKFSGLTEVVVKVGEVVKNHQVIGYIQVPDFTPNNDLDLDRFLKAAKAAVVAERASLEIVMEPEELYIVWFSKTLGNWKATLSTLRGDALYYEVTYNGNQHETYVDVYHKIHNFSIPDPKED